MAANNPRDGLPDDIPRSWGLLSLAALVAIVVIPPVLCTYLGAAEWKSVVAGAAIWLVSFAAKRPLASALRSFRILNRSNSLKGATQGALSAVVELAPVGVFYYLTGQAKFADILAFGVGAGSFEAAYIVGLGFMRPRPAPATLMAWAKGAAQSLLVRYMAPLERGSALLGHVGSRGLIYLGLHAHMPSNILLIACALILFTLIDAVAVYGHEQKWDWNDPILSRRTQLFFASVGLAECLLFVFGFHNSAP